MAGVDTEDRNDVRLQAPLSAQGDAQCRQEGKLRHRGRLGQDIFAGLKHLIGGEISEYTKLQAESREQSIQRMIEDASLLGADAIINIRFTTSMVMQGAAEILAYGTAVKLR